MADQDDPFEPFRRLTEQFTTDTGSTAPMGIPPVPVSEGGNESPGQQTKAAVRALYEIIEATSQTDQETTPMAAWNQYLDAMGVDTGVSPEQLGSVAISTYRIWFVSLAQLLVDAYTVRLLHDELVDEAYRNGTDTQKWLWTLPQSDREELLLRCLGVDADLVAEMRTTRSRRDELLYEILAWTETDVDDAFDDARHYVAVLERLDGLVSDGDGFSFQPGKSDASDEETSETDATDGTGDDA
ncbi:MAG: hypothetical protein ACI8XM_001984 [Haloarculaceae archaeon]|jgi:hypothetical protein